MAIVLIPVKSLGAEQCLQRQGRGHDLPSVQGDLQGPARDHRPLQISLQLPAAAVTAQTFQFLGQLVIR